MWLLELELWTRVGCLVENEWGSWQIPSQNQTDFSELWPLLSLIHLMRALKCASFFLDWAYWDMLAVAGPNLSSEWELWGHAFHLQTLCESHSWSWLGWYNFGAHSASLTITHTHVVILCSGILIVKSHLRMSGIFRTAPGNLILK